LNRATFNGVNTLAPPPLPTHPRVHYSTYEIPPTLNLAGQSAVCPSAVVNKHRTLTIWLSCPSCPVLAVVPDHPYSYLVFFSTNCSCRFYRPCPGSSSNKASFRRLYLVTQGRSATKGLQHRVRPWVTGNSRDGLPAQQPVKLPDPAIGQPLLTPVNLLSLFGRGLFENSLG
jgi:hypothetical protein